MLALAIQYRVDPFERGEWYCDVVDDSTTSLVPMGYDGSSWKSASASSMSELRAMTGRASDDIWGLSTPLDGKLWSAGLRLARRN